MTMASAESPDTVFCALETSQYPHAVLYKGMATRHVRVPVRLRCGGGAAPINRMRPAPPLQEPEGAANQRPRVRAHAPMGADAFNAASHAEPWGRLGPCWASEATGAPTPLHEPCRTVRISNTVARLRMS
jgi:hypothetical protein